MAAVARAPVNLREPLLPIIVGDHRIKRGGGGGDVGHVLHLVVGLEQQRAEAIRAGAQGEHCGGLRRRRGRRGDGGGRRILGEEVLQDHPAGGGVEVGGGESDVLPNFFHGFGEAAYGEGEEEEVEDDSDVEEIEEEKEEEDDVHIWSGTPM